MAPAQGDMQIREAFRIKKKKKSTSPAPSGQPQSLLFVTTG